MSGGGEKLGFEKVETEAGGGEKCREWFGTEEGGRCHFLFGKK